MLILLGIYIISTSFFFLTTYSFIRYHSKAAVHPNFNSNVFSKKILRQSSLPICIEKVQESQWKLLKNYHLGNWKGIQTGYDPDVAEVADHMYIDSKLSYNDEEKTVKHITAAVMGEIRSDCEVCFDSERVREKLVGIYNSTNLRYRYCENVELKGPGTTPRGLSCELTFRSENTRIRVLLAMTPSDFEDYENIGSVPSELKISDIVITRESLAERPLQLDGAPHNLWTPISLSGLPFEIPSKIVYERRRHRLNVEGEGEVDVQQLTGYEKLQPLESSNSNIELNSHTNEIVNDSPILYSRIFPGGIKVESYYYLYPGEETVIRVSWAPPYEENSRIYAAEIKFAALEEIRESNGRLMISPPKLLDFFVDHYIPKK